MTELTVHILSGLLLLGLVVSWFVTREPTPEPTPEPEENSPNRSEDILRQALSSQEGRQRLAQAMVNPIRQRLDYASVARRVSQVQQLPMGALPASAFPQWATMGAWVQHKDSKVFAQVIDAVDKGTAVLEPWEGHAFVPDTFDEETKVSPDGNLHVTSAGVWGHWTEAKAPQNYPSLWDHIRDETLD